MTKDDMSSECGDDDGWTTSDRARLFSVAESQLLEITRLALHTPEKRETERPSLCLINTDVNDGRNSKEKRSERPGRVTCPQDRARDPKCEEGSGVGESEVDYSRPEDRCEEGNESNEQQRMGVGGEGAEQARGGGNRQQNSK